jgi:histidine ammonia-lyase
VMVPEIVLADGPTALDEVVAIADGAKVSIGSRARDLLSRSRRTLEASLATGEAVYGATTGVGDARDATRTSDNITQGEATLVRMHAGAFGPPLPRPVVRAAMAARLVGLCRGGSGASPAVADMLAALLNCDIVPLVPATASVGAADLGAHAYIGLVAMGEGQADVGGEVMRGAEALNRAGLAPLTLQAKDAIALISANGLTLGRGSLVLARVARVLQQADEVAATSLDVVKGNPSILDPLVQDAKGIPGQSAVAQRMRRHLQGSDRTAHPASLQDALSFRVIPQVHGAAAEVLAQAESAVASELNAQADNPLAAAGSDRVVSNGNFHPILVALVFESLRVALAHVAQLSDRRAGVMWDNAVGALSGATGGSPEVDPSALSGLALRYPSATRSAAARQLANPVTLDTPVLDRGHEDHATNAPEAVAATDQLLDVLLDLLATETLLARTVLELDPTPPPSGKSDALLASVAPIGGDAPRPPHEAHAQARTALADEWQG